MEKKEQYIKFDSIDDAQKYAERTGNLVMFMENQVIDATTFATHHPGGKARIASAKGKDITEDIKAHFPLAENLAHSMLIGYVGKEKERVLDPAKPLALQIWKLNQN